MRKNKIEKKTDPGNVASASGYTMKMRPDPEKERKQKIYKPHKNPE